jgi:hypothetical protein
VLGAVAEHHPNLVPDERLPVVAVALLGLESQDIDEVSDVAVEVRDGKDVSVRTHGQLRRP